MSKHIKLVRAERFEIAILLKKNYSMRSIAEVLKRGKTTISNEIANNSTDGVYEPIKADRKARLRKRMSKFQWKKINQDEKLRTYIIAKLKLGWNPDEIAGRMKLEKKSFYASKTAIYEWLRTSRGDQYCKYLYSQRHYVKRRKKKTKRAMIPDRVSITERPLGAHNRSRYGHWEEDTIVACRQGSGALAVMVGRKSKLLRINKLNTMKPSEHVDVLRKNISGLKVLSMTFDNGIENKNHTELDIPTFFCDPYSSWQKGSVENVNKMIRHYIPKGSDISKISPKYIQWVENRINKKPRKVLGYRTAEEVAILGGIILKDKVS